MLISPRSSALWKGFKGVNTSSGGVQQTGGWYVFPTYTVNATYPTGYNTGCYQTLSTYLNPTRLAKMAGYGFDHIRLITNLSPVYQAQYLSQSSGSTTIRDGMIADIVAGIRLVLAAGLAVNLDAHVSPSDAGGWTNVNIVTGLSTSGTKYQVMKAAQVAIVQAMKAAQLPYDMVCFEIMNEPPYDNQIPGFNAWWSNTAVPDLENALHTADPLRTLIVEGSQLGGPDGLAGYQIGSTLINPDASGLVGLAANKFIAPRNCLYSFHFYGPYTMCNAGAGYSSPGASWTAGGDPSWWGTGLDFRDYELNGVYNTTNLATAIQASQSQAANDPTIASGNLAAIQAAISSALTNTYQYQGTTFCIGDIAGAAGTGRTGQVNIAERAMRALTLTGVPLDNSQIYMGEFGCVGYQSGNFYPGVPYYPNHGNVQAGRDAWFATIYSQAARKGMRCAVFEWDQPYGMSIAPQDVIPATTRAALGLN